MILGVEIIRIFKMPSSMSSREMPLENGDFFESFGKEIGRNIGACGL